MFELFECILYIVCVKISCEKRKLYVLDLREFNWGKCDVDGSGKVIK